MGSTDILSNAVALTPPNTEGTDRTESPVVITGQQVDLIRKTIAVGASDAELDLFFYDCRRRGVHPLDKLIHFTKRGGKYTPITSIDFMRSRAAETGEYAGNYDPVFVGTPKHSGFSARAVVYRLVQGEAREFSATARWPEYRPPGGQDHMWQKMPHTMLGKCAEALALRKAFPQQLSGLYAAEELDQATERSALVPKGEPAAIPPPLSAGERRALVAIYRKTGHTDADVQQWLLETYGVGHSKEIPRNEYAAIVARLIDPAPLLRDVAEPDEQPPDEPAA